MKKMLELRAARKNRHHKTHSLAEASHKSKLVHKHHAPKHHKKAKAHKKSHGAKAAHKHTAKKPIQKHTEKVVPAVAPVQTQKK